MGLNSAFNVQGKASGLLALKTDSNIFDSSPTALNGGSKGGLTDYGSSIWTERSSGWYNYKMGWGNLTKAKGIISGLPLGPLSNAMDVAFTYTGLVNAIPTSPAWNPVPKSKPLLIAIKCLKGTLKGYCYPIDFLKYKVQTPSSGDMYVLADTNVINATTRYDVAIYESSWKVLLQNGELVSEEAYTSS